MNNRLYELLGSTPPATLAIMSICLIVYMFQITMNLDLEQFTMCPRLVIYLHEYYRFVTSALFHGSFIHVGMNMVSTFHLSTMLEKRLGTLPHLTTTLGAILVTSMVYTLVAGAASFLFGYDDWMYQHSVGFSGVLFHFCVLECNMISNGPRSLFGIVHVPPPLYPWALLIILQMFMPNLSFLGHLSGILTGTLQFYGLLGVITIGRDVDDWLFFASLSRLPGFVFTQTENRNFQEPSALFHSMAGGCRSVRRIIGHVIETLSVCIFGRGYRWNSNIRLWTSKDSSGGQRVGSALEDDEEWGGLPTIASLPVDVESIPTSRLV